MNPELPHPSPEELEASLTALLLGELPAEEAEALRQKIEQDAELAALYRRLELTIDLVREMAHPPVAQPEAQPAPLRLSDERREKLLASFKTVRPREFAQPPRRRSMSLLVPAALAAVLVGVLAVVTLLPGGRDRTKYDEMADAEVLSKQRMHPVEESVARSSSVQLPAGGFPQNQEKESVGLGFQMPWQATDGAVTMSGGGGERGRTLFNAITLSADSAPGSGSESRNRFGDLGQALPKPAAPAVQPVSPPPAPATLAAGRFETAQQAPPATPAPRTEIVLPSAGDTTPGQIERYAKEIPPSAGTLALNDANGISAGNNALWDNKQNLQPHAVQPTAPAYPPASTAGDAYFSIAPDSRRLVTIADESTSRTISQTLTSLDSSRLTKGAVPPANVASTPSDAAMGGRAGVFQNVTNAAALNFAGGGGFGGFRAAPFGAETKPSEFAAAATVPASAPSEGLSLAAGKEKEVMRAPVLGKSEAGRGRETVVAGTTIQPQETPANTDPSGHGTPVAGVTSASGQTPVLGDEPTLGRMLRSEATGRRVSAKSSMVRGEEASQTEAQRQSEVAAGGAAYARRYGVAKSQPAQSQPAKADEKKTTEQSPWAVSARLKGYYDDNPPATKGSDLALKPMPPAAEPAQARVQFDQAKVGEVAKGERVDIALPQLSYGDSLARADTFGREGRLLDGDGDGKNLFSGQQGVRAPAQNEQADGQTKLAEKLQKDLVDPDKALAERNVAREKLAAYEFTGLTPKQTTTLKDEAAGKQATSNSSDGRQLADARTQPADQARLRIQLRNGGDTTLGVVKNYYDDEGNSATQSAEKPAEAPQVAWADKMHGKQGMTGLADGSIQPVTESEFRNQLRNSGDTSLSFGYNFEKGNTPAQSAEKVAEVPQRGLAANTEGKAVSEESKARKLAEGADVISNLDNAAKLVQDGKLLYEMGRLDEAETKLKEATKANPENDAAHYYLNVLSKARFQQALNDRETDSREKLNNVEEAWATPKKSESLPQPNPYARTNFVFSAKDTNPPSLAFRSIKVDPKAFQQGMESVVGFDWGAIAQASSNSRSGSTSGMMGGGILTVPRVSIASDAPGTQKAVRDFLTSLGVDLTPPKSVFYNEREGTLLIHAAPEDHDIITRAIQVLNLGATNVPAAEPDEPKKQPTPGAPIPQPEVQTRDNAFSTFSLNVSDVSFKLAAASLEKGQMPEPANVRSEEFINAFDYRDPEAPAGVPIAFAFERARYPFAHNRDLLRFSLKTAAQGRQAGRPLNLVLLLDNSGSMERADRVRIISEALRVLAGQLTAQDKLSVALFARTARLWVDGVSGDQAGKVADEAGGLTPQGGTNLEEAMNLAYQTALRHYLANGINRVVLLTDGAANLGDVAPESLKQKVEAHRKQGIALDCFGIGWEGYNDDLLEVLSRNGDGRYGFINTPEEATTGFANQLAGALRVAASDVKVQVEFNPARVSAYRQIGYAKHQLKKEQFRDNTVDAAEIGAAECGNALYVAEVNPQGEGPLAIVRVRYKVPGTSDYREQEWVAPYTGNCGPLEQASPALRLATAASAFSEWLVSSPFATEVTPDQLLVYLGGVPEVYGADARPRKLEWMIRQAKSIAGK